MINPTRAAVLTTLVAAAGLTPCPTHAQDVAGSQDHPLVSRYEGSTIIAYNVREFDEYRLLLGSVIEDGSEPDRRRITDSRTLEGKVTRISYHLPGDRSTLEVMRNYERELEGAGFEILFSCSNPDCGGRMFNHTVVEYARGFAENYEDHRYLAARRATAEDEVHVALYVVRNTSEGGPTHNQIFYHLTVVESEPMEEGMVSVDAETMAREIAETGSVSIYGIYFDTDRAEVKPESRPTLEEIATLLQAETDLQLYVVGHTDSTGQLDYNMDLSRRRADAVVEALVNEHGIEPTRLTARGVGPLAPVSSNESEPGRALNRRVELVRR